MKRMMFLAALALSVSAGGLATAAEPRKTPVAVGETVPDFSLKDQNGQTVKLSASWGERPVVLVFYRGYW